MRDSPSPLPQLSTQSTQAASEQSVGEVDVLETGKMGKRKDVSDFDKGQIVMARRLGQSISKRQVLWSVVSKSGPKKDNQ